MTKLWGTVVEWNDSKGFGTIRPDLYEDVFGRVIFNRQSLHAGGRAGLTPKKGDRIEFEVTARAFRIFGLGESGDVESSV